MSRKIPCEGYYRPLDMEEAIRLLETLGESAMPIAGGTDVLPCRPGGEWATNQKNLLDLSALALDYIENRNDTLAIGAMTPINRLLEAPIFTEGALSIMKETAALHSTHLIRNRATLGGNLCIGWPTADFSLPLLVLNAVLMAVGASGERPIPIDQFFTGANLTDLHSGELLKEILIPACKPHVVAVYKKLRRHQTAVDIAVVNVAVSLTMDNGRCLDAKIALGGAGPVPFRTKEAEKILKGESLKQKLIETAARFAASEAAPIDDVRATAIYRKKMIYVLVRDAICESIERGKR